MQAIEPSDKRPAQGRQRLQEMRVGRYRFGCGFRSGVVSGRFGGREPARCERRKKRKIRENTSHNDQIARRHGPDHRHTHDYLQHAHPDGSAPPAWAGAGAHLREPVVSGWRPHGVRTTSASTMQRLEIARNPVIEFLNRVFENVSNSNLLARSVFTRLCWFVPDAARSSTEQVQAHSSRPAVFHSAKSTAKDAAIDATRAADDAPH